MIIYVEELPKGTVLGMKEGAIKGIKGNVILVGTGKEEQAASGF